MLDEVRSTTLKYCDIKEWGRGRTAGRGQEKQNTIFSWHLQQELTLAQATARRSILNTQDSFYRKTQGFSNIYTHHQNSYIFLQACFYQNAV